jgi:hypothetical protein
MDEWSNLQGSADMNSSIPCFLALSASENQGGKKKLKTYTLNYTVQSINH